MNIPICVLTCDSYLWMLRPFAFLFNTFWGEDQEVRIYGYKPIFKILEDLPPNFKFYSIAKDEYPIYRWSDSLIEVIHKLQVEHFILFLEDFWLNAPVYYNVVETLIEYVKENPDVLRLDLTNNRLSKKNARIVERINDIGIVETPLPASYSMSFQTGIWNSDLALQVLREGETPWQAEIDGTKRVNKLKGSMRVLGSDKRPVKYQPVYRNRKHQLNIDKIPTHLLNAIMKRGWLDG